MEEKSKEQWLIRICCFIAAFSLWLYVVNSDSTMKTVKIPVSVEIVNKDAITSARLVPLPNQKYTVTLSITGEAKNVYSVKAEQFRVIADMSSFSLKKGENRVPIEVKMSPSNVNVLNENLWVKINLDDLIQKSIAVKTNIDVKTKYGYFAGDPVVTPSNVTVSGPYDYVNAVSNVMVKGESKDVDKDVFMTCQAFAVDAGGKVINEVKVEPGTVDVTIPVKKSKEVAVNIVTKGDLQNGVILKSMEATQKKVYITGDDSVLSRINGINTEAIDLSKLSTSVNMKVKLDIPKDIKVVDSVSLIDVSIVIDKTIQKTIALTVELRNVPTGLSATSKELNVSLVVSGSENVINSLKDGDIKAYVDLQSAVEGETNYNVSLTLPTGVNQVSIDKKAIKISIVKTNAPKTP